MYYLPYIIATEQPVPHITGNADFNIMSLPLNPFREYAGMQPSFFICGFFVSFFRYALRRLKRKPDTIIQYIIIVLRHTQRVHPPRCSGGAQVRDVI